MEEVSAAQSLQFHLTLLHSHSLCSSHRSPSFLKQVEPSPVPRSSLLQCHLPSTLVLRSSCGRFLLLTQDSAQLTLPQRALLWQLYVQSAHPSHPLSYCTAFFPLHIHLHRQFLIFCLPPLQCNFHRTGVCFVFTVLSLLPRIILKYTVGLNTSWMNERLAPKPMLFLLPLLFLIYVKQYHTPETSLYF